MQSQAEMTWPGGVPVTTLAKLLTPVMTPLRNRIPRQKGVGTARQFKRITGFSGTGTGGVANLRAGISGSGVAFGPATYLRGQKITYAGDQVSVPYIEFGLSDSVSFSAQFAGEGFQDIRQLSQTSLLHASMLSEERTMLGGRGTAAGFAGALATPGTPTLTVRNAATGETGNTANIATLYVWVTAATVFGETLAGVANTTGMSAATGKVVDVQLPAAVTGAQFYKVYVGTTNAAASMFPAPLSIVTAATPTPCPVGQVSCLSIASGTSGSVTISFTGGAAGGVANAGTNPPAAATDSSAQDYDGVLTVCTGANSGYSHALNSTWSNNPGDEYNNAFSSLWDSVKADPELVLIAGADRKSLSDRIKNAANATAYRISLTADQATGATVGAVVTALQNEVTARMVDLNVHPWIPQGISPILSMTLPIPDTNVSDTWVATNVQDYMAISWPVLQMSYDASSYWYGTFHCYAPAWQACLTNIIKG